LYSPALLEAVDWCLHMNQLERPQNVDDLAAVLNQPYAAPSNNGGSNTLFDRIRNKLSGQKKDSVT
jgi:hypothetical protein